tara:strand:- start:284 stop:1141 length:858 start_codon:yes stop_codon:yes gene_type:complete
MNFLKILTKGLLWLLDALPKQKEEDKREKINKTRSKEKSPVKKEQEILKNTKIDSKQKSKIKTKRKSDSTKLEIKQNTNINEKISKNKIQKKDIIEIKSKKNDQDNDLTILEIKTPGKKSLESEKIPQEITPIKVDNKKEKEEIETINLDIDENFSVNIKSASEKREEDIETRSLLGEIFNQEDQPEKEIITTKMNEESSPYNSYINELIELINNNLNSNEFISRRLFEDFAAERKLMINALIDSINDYSLANFDQLLVEEEDDSDILYIDLEILAQIRKTKPVK